MKKGIHPENYRPVVFKDMSNGDMFLSQSTCKTNDTVLRLKSLAPLTHSTQVRASSLILLVALTAS